MWTHFKKLFQPGMFQPWGHYQQYNAAHIQAIKVYILKLSGQVSCNSVYSLIKIMWNLYNFIMQTLIGSRCYPWSHSWTRWIESASYFCYTSLKYYPPICALVTEVFFFLQILWLKFSLCLAACHVCRFLIFMTLSYLCKENKSWSSSWCSFMHPPMTFSLILSYVLSIINCRTN
jgi:hypothetical protein